MFIIDLETTTLSREEIQILKNPDIKPFIKGIILFSRNYTSRLQLKKLIADIRELRADIFICVDQEGGRVQRFKDATWTRLPAFAKFGKYYRTDPDAACLLAKEVGWLMASEVLSAEIDFSFSPVLDLQSSVSAVIGDRSFDPDPNIVVECAKAFVAGMHEAGMIAVGKHFPGHGSVSEDSHIAVPVDKRTFDNILEQDLRPFEALAPIVDAIMPAHVIYPECDENPAGFSPFWIKEILQKKMGFRGAVISDDIVMQGATVAGNLFARVEKAYRAGCHLILICQALPRGEIQSLLLETRAYFEKNSLSLPVLPAALCAKQKVSIDLIKKSDRYARITQKLLKWE